MITTEMIRPFWEDKPQLEDITVLICQNKTYDLIRLSVESLLNHYPTIKILVVDGSPNDASGKWLAYKAAITDNLSVWIRVGYDSHGVAMDEAIRQKINTRYVLTLDSDVIIKRAGWIEKMRRSIKGLFAIGALMEVTRKNHACGSPENESDVLRYIHPSTMLFDRNIYLQLKPFTDHGAPCVYTMIDAEERGLKVKGFPVAEYVMHLSGASWTEPRTIWSWDNGVAMRPIVTFVCNPWLKINPAGNDYDVVHAFERVTGKFVIHGQEPRDISSTLFQLRFKVSGDFVCVADTEVTGNIITELMGHVITNPSQSSYKIREHTFYTRKEFQSNIAL